MKNVIGLVVAMAVVLSAPHARALEKKPYLSPSYWDQFALAKAAGWSNPDFFPIAVWFDSVRGKQSAVEKAIGINTYLALTDDSNPAIITSRGQFDILQAGKDAAGKWHFPMNTRADKNSVGYLVADEPDMKFGPGWLGWDGTDDFGKHCTGLPPDGKGGCGYSMLKTLADGFPKNDGRFLFVNFGKGIAWESDKEFGQFVNGPWADVVSVDFYWYTDKDTCTPWQGAKLLGQAGTQLTPDQCHRASNYGVLMDRMRAVDALDGKLKPIWGVVEAGPPKGLYPLGISPEEIQGAVVSELIHGANGIVYFNHIFQPPCISYHFLRDSPSCTARHPRAKNIVPAVKEMNRLIEKLAPVLNSPSYVWTFNPQLDTRRMFSRSRDRPTAAAMI
jgi:hypothetical protein